MFASKISSRKLKITLDSKESAELINRLYKVPRDNLQLKHILRILLSKAAAKTDFTLDCERIYVELFPSVNSGLIIFFTKYPQVKKYRLNSAKVFKYLLEFSDSDSVIRAAKAFAAQKKDCFQSSLFKKQDKYYLIISCKTGIPITYALLTEFADRCVCSHTASAIVSEYGKKILSENAVDLLAKI